MLGKKEKNGALTSGGQTLNTIIGRGTTVEGTMKVDNSVRIDGEFKGELSCSGALTISQSGQADAHLDGKEIYINGKVKGTVRAQKVRLDALAQFVGDVHTGVLSVTEGAIFHGQCSMESEKKAPAKLEADNATSKAAPEEKAKPEEKAADQEAATKSPQPNHK